MPARGEAEGDEIISIIMAREEGMQAERTGVTGGMYQ